MAAERIAIEVACAEPDRQTVIALEVPLGCTAGEAVERSAILARHPALDPASCGVGIFGREGVGGSPGVHQRRPALEKRRELSEVIVGPEESKAPGVLPAVNLDVADQVSVEVELSGDVCAFHRLPLRTLGPFIGQTIAGDPPEITTSSK